MPLSPALLRDLRAAGLEVEPDARLARRTWWRVGGPADALLTAHEPDQLVQLQRLAHRAGLPVLPLGNASNLLISDAGVRGLVLRLRGGLAGIGVEGSRLHAGGGARLPVILRRAARQGWPGLGPFAGIPGTVGGAVRMNAGASLGETSDILDRVQLVLPEGERVELARSELSMGYRSCRLPASAVVVGAVFRLEGDAQASQQAIAAHMDRRQRTQPLDQRTCGSTWRNPPGDYAARLIESCGLKGMRIGDAQVSPKHANFLVNLGHARAVELRELMRRVEARVKAEHGVSLVREVHLAGDWR